jgi:hypothetical protein
VEAERAALQVEESGAQASRARVDAQDKLCIIYH